MSVAFIDGSDASRRRFDTLLTHTRAPSSASAGAMPRSVFFTNAGMTVVYKAENTLGWKSTSAAMSFIFMPLWRK